LESWRERVPNFRACKTEAAGDELRANEWNGEQIGVGQLEAATGMTSMQDRE